MGYISTSALFVWLISHQPAVLFSQNKSAISNQPTVFFSQNKPAPAISHQPTEQAARKRRHDGDERSLAGLLEFESIAI
jgi:hypothetical protein